MKKNVSLISLLIVGISSIGYAQDSVSTQSTSKQTYTTTTTEKTYKTDPGARQFRPFKVGLGAGYAVPGKGDGAGGGVLLFVEPAYRASDRVSIGLRLESAVIVRGVKGVNNNNDVSGNASSNLSYTLNGQYYFNNNNVRPFVGAGFGLFSLAAVKFNTANGNTTTNEIGAETSFGFYPRIGIDAGHFNLTLDYNIIPSTNVPTGGTVINNYLGIRAGISIGGGRIRN